MGVWRGGGKYVVPRRSVRLIVHKCTFLVYTCIVKIVNRDTCTGTGKVHVNSNVLVGKNVKMYRFLIYI